MYEVDILIPTARFVFSVEGERVDVLGEHRSPEAFEEYRRLREQRPVVGMTTFPNTLLVRGARTIVVDPGLPLQNEPVVRALEARGIDPAEVDQVVLTHAHVDHAGGCADLAAPVVVHECETAEPYWAQADGFLRGLPLVLLTGREGEIAPGVRWALTPGHSAGHVSLAVETRAGTVVLCGDTVGPGCDDFRAMAPGGPAAGRLLESWRRIRAWDPVTVIAGHVPPFSP